jgi:HEPN domain-containing protein
MKKRIRKEVIWWLESGFESLEDAKESYKRKRWDLVAYFSHQAVEKALKGTIIDQLRKFATGHNLRGLYSLLKTEKKLSLSQDLEDFLGELTLHYLPSRYPNIAHGVPSKVYTRGVVEGFIEKVERILNCLAKTVGYKK